MRIGPPKQIVQLFTRVYFFRVCETHAAKQLPQSSWTSLGYKSNTAGQNRSIPEIEPVENKGCKQEVNYTLECGHVCTSCICNNLTACLQVTLLQIFPGTFPPASRVSAHSLSSSSFSNFTPELHALSTGRSLSRATGFLTYLMIQATHSSSGTNPGIRVTPNLLFFAVKVGFRTYGKPNLSKPLNRHDLVHCTQVSARLLSRRENALRQHSSRLDNLN